MSQNPFDQQQNPFGQQQQQQQQQNPFGQAPQQNPFGQQQQGFGSGPSGFQQPMEPKKSGGGMGRCLLIFLGLFLVGCLVCCGITVWGISTQGNTVMAFAWAGSVGTGDYAGIVCPGSQAESFSDTFESNYSSFTLNDWSSSGDVVTISGTGTTRFSGTRDVSLTMTLNPDEGDLASIGLGCIERIESN